MSQPATAPGRKRRVLVADDTPAILELIVDVLEGSGYELVLAEDGAQAVERFKEQRPDLVLLDMMMPKLSGIDVCRWIKSSGAAAGPFVPVVMISAIADTDSKIEGLDAGADDWLVKPFNPFELKARIGAMLRIKDLQDELAIANAKLSQTNAQLSTSNVRLSQSNQDLTSELDRMSQLKRFLPSGVVNEVLAFDAAIAAMASPKRKEITILFADIRNFTAISDQIDPEDVKEILDVYLGWMTRVVDRYQGSVNKFMGDGIMVLFGDPVPQEDHALRALQAAIEMREVAGALQAQFHSKLPAEIFVGIGVHTGIATVGALGTGNQIDYTAVGSSVNLAARLQTIALRSQVIASSSTYEALRDRLELKDERREQIKGFAHPIKLAEILTLR